MTARKVPGIEVRIPGRSRPFRIQRVVLDFNGTIAVDGRLIRGVATTLRQLARRVEVVVMTADTFGSARQALRNLPVTIQIVSRGAEKRKFVESIGAKTVAAVGNGTNDVPMLRAAGLGIAVIEEEGMSAALLSAATVLVRDIHSAFDLLLEPKRLVATLRR